MYCFQELFTVSVGNLPAGATVLIKMTYVCELSVDECQVILSLPNAVAPWDAFRATNQKTQVSRSPSIGWFLHFASTIAVVSSAFQSATNTVQMKASEQRVRFEGNAVMAKGIRSVTSSHDVDQKVRIACASFGAFRFTCFQNV